MDPLDGYKRPIGKRCPGGGEGIIQQDDIGVEGKNVIGLAMGDAEIQSQGFIESGGGNIQLTDAGGFRCRDQVVCARSVASAVEHDHFCLVFLEERRIRGER